jgi:hypothetical protein
MKVVEIARGATIFPVNASVPLASIADAGMCDIYGR